MSSYKKIVKIKRLNLSAIKNREDKLAATEEVADYLEDEILRRVQNGNSPVGGEGKFKALSKNYKKIKVKSGGSGRPDMELTGELLDDFEVRVEGAGKISIGFHEDKSQETLGKADGHNNFSGRSKLPKRRFIPSKKQKFKREIESEIKGIIEDYASED